MRPTALLAALAVALGLAVTTAPATSATADVSVALPMTTFRDLVVDAPHDHVFVSGGGSTGIVVRTLAGAAVTTITDQPGATGLALSPDGTTLYVALSLGDAVSAIDTTTLTQTARYATGASTCPGSVVAVGSVVWFGYGCDGASGNIGVVDLSGDPPVVTLAKSPSSFSYYPQIEMAPGDPTRMLAGDHGQSTLWSLTVSGTTLTANTSRAVGENLQDFALTADGAKVVTASGWPYYHQRYLTSDLSADGVFGNQLPYPYAVAISGTFVAAGTEAWYDKDVRVYQSDGTLLRDYELRDYEPGTDLMPGGLAFAPDGSTLYAVSSDHYGGTYLHVLHDPTKQVTTLTLSKPATAKIDATYNVMGSLTPVPTGTTVHVSRSSTYGTVALPDVTTTNVGTFTIPDTVAKRGAYTYTATYDGDSARLGATTSLVVSVAGLTPTLTITTNATYAYHAIATVTAHLGTTHTNRTVRISATPYAQGTTTLKTGVVNSSGNLAVTYQMNRRTTFTAYFAGDDTYEPRTVTRIVTTYVALAEALSGYYTTSGSYRVYHQAKDPVLNTTVTPIRSGTCMSFVAQKYTSSGWVTVATNSCIKLSTTSHASAVLTGTPALGVAYRVRATFNGDMHNAKTTGAWLYLKFTT